MASLYYGANKSNQPEKRTQEIAHLEKLATLLPVTSKTARIYGEIKNELKLKVKPIPENDIWIASVSIEYGIPLITRDKHFEHIDGIKIEFW